MSKQTYNTADYANNIQATIDDVPAGGGLVIVAPGSYSITNPIILKKGITLAGTGWRSTRIYPTTAMSSILSVSGTDQLSISDVYIRGINLDGANLANYGIDMDFARNTNYIRDVYIEKCLVAGIAFRDGSWTNKIMDSIISHCGRGMDLQLNANCITIDNCQFEYNTGAGLWSYENYSLRILSCQFSANGSAGTEQYGVFIRGGAGVSVRDCYFEGNGIGEGRHIGIDGQSRGMVIEGGHFQGLDTYTRYAIDAQSCTNLSIIGGHSERHVTATVNVGNDGVNVITAGLHSSDLSTGNATKIW
jgi:hypothetical protein